MLPPNSPLDLGYDQPQTDFQHQPPPRNTGQRRKARRLSLTSRQRISVPAFDRAFADHNGEIDAIANNPDAPTFDNTIVTLERAGSVLDRVSSGILRARRRAYQRRPSRHRARDIAADGGAQEPHSP